MKRNQILTFACILLAFLLIAGCAAPAAAAPGAPAPRRWRCFGWRRRPLPIVPGGVGAL